MTELPTALYDEMQRIARRLLLREFDVRRPSTRSLVHEAFLKLAPSGVLSHPDDAFVRRCCAQTMRHLLVDRARTRAAAKRDGVRLPLPTEGLAGADPAVLLDLDDALSRLHRVDAMAAQVAELRLFGAYTHEEVAEALHVPLGAARRHWGVAVTWLSGEYAR